MRLLEAAATLVSLTQSGTGEGAWKGARLIAKFTMYDAEVRHGSCIQEV